MYSLRELVISGETFLRGKKYVVNESALNVYFWIHLLKGLITLHYILH